MKQIRHINRDRMDGLFDCQSDESDVKSSHVYCFNSSLKLQNCTTPNYTIEFTLSKHSK